MLYYQVLKNYLETAVYDVDSAKERIAYAVARGRITTEQAEALEGIVEQYATEPPLSEQVTALRRRLETYKGLVAWSDLADGVQVDEGTVVLWDGILYCCTVTHFKQSGASPAMSADVWRMAS